MPKKKLDNLEKTKGAYGGKREGSGRKASIAKLEDADVQIRIAKKFVELAEKYAIPYYENVMNGTEPTTPDVKNKVANTIADRALGKVKEKIEHSNDAENPVGVLLLPAKKILE